VLLYLPDFSSSFPCLSRFSFRSKKSFAMMTDTNAPAARRILRTTNGTLPPQTGRVACGWLRAITEDRSPRMVVYLREMGSSYEFDKDNQVLLVHFHGRLSDDSLGALAQAGEKYWAATKPRAEIIDCSGVTEFAVSSDRIRQLAKRQIMPEAANLPRVIVTPETHAYGLARMYQITGEQSRPQTTVVRTMDEALKALNITSPHFEPLD
jgi:hypothetical protein